MEQQAIKMVWEEWRDDVLRHCDGMDEHWIRIMEQSFYAGIWLALMNLTDAPMGEVSDTLRSLRDECREVLLADQGNGRC